MNPAILDDYRNETPKTQAALLIDEAIIGLTCAYELLDHSSHEKVEAYKLAKLIKPHVATLKKYISTASDV